MKALLVVLGVSGWMLFAREALRNRPSPETVADGAIAVSPTQSSIPIATPITVPRSRGVKKTEPSPADHALIEAARFARDQNPEGAVAVLREALAADPENSELNAEMGKLFWRRLGKPELAADHFEKSLKENPDQPEVLPDLVEIYSAPEARARGKAFLSSLSERAYPHRAGPALALAHFKARTENPQTAAEWLVARAADLDRPEHALQFAEELKSGAAE